jgi:nicotinate-nucleotide adenylyltransferase
MRLGLFGGSFDPVHFGHLRAAEELSAHFKFDRLIFIPAAQHPHKQLAGPADFRHRLAMLKLAIKDRPGFEVTDLEESLPRPSYTVNTLRALKEKEKEELFFLVGYDSFQSIRKWRGYEELITLVSLVVFRRPGQWVLPGDREALGRLLTGIMGGEPLWDETREAFIRAGFNPVHYYQGLRLDISSTYIKERMAHGDSVRYLVPEEVRVYLARHGLYIPKN